MYLDDLTARTLSCLSISYSPGQPPRPLSPGAGCCRCCILRTIPHWHTGYLVHTSIPHTTSSSLDARTPVHARLPRSGSPCARREPREGEGERENRERVHGVHVGSHAIRFGQATPPVSLFLILRWDLSHLALFPRPDPISPRESCLSRSRVPAPERARATLPSLSRLGRWHQLIGSIRLQPTLARRESAVASAKLVRRSEQRNRLFSCQTTRLLHVP